jgi:CheY-like chemotaxis protein
MTAGPATPTPEDVERLAPGLTQVEPPAAPGVPTWRYTLGVLRAATPYVRLRVADSGGGIGPILMEHIFEPFFTTKDKARGTGLGLAVAASVVAAHHGCIVVTSALGHGSVFEIYLPRVPAEAAAAAATHERGAGGGHGRVMLIDDEIDLADGLSMALSAMGYEALPVYDPEEALELFAENPAVWDVVVTDQVMPRLKGLSVIRQLKRLRPDIPVILYTGFSDMADEQEALGAGAAAFARKPISAERLAALLRDVIESRARVAAAE